MKPSVPILGLFKYIRSTAVDQLFAVKRIDIEAKKEWTNYPGGLVLNMYILYGLSG